MEKLKDVIEPTTIKIYRAQDTDSKVQRVEVVPGKSITFTDPPLNISLKSPDHALYFAEEHKDCDIIEFEIPLAFYQKIITLLAPAGTQSGAPTFNDPTTPGFKVEIKKGDLFDEFKKQAIPTSGEVTKYNLFVEKYAKVLYSEAWVHQLAIATLGEAPKMLKQIQNVLTLCDITWDGKENWEKIDTGDEVYVDWKTASEKLWKIRNAAYVQALQQKK